MVVVGGVGTSRTAATAGAEYVFCDCLFAIKPAQDGIS